MISRRKLLCRLGVGSAVMPFLANLPSLAMAGSTGARKRLVIVFSPDGVVRDQFWPKEAGAFKDLPPVLKPLEPFKDRLLTL